MSELHNCGVVHRDLAMRNILVDKDRICLIDFERSACTHDGSSGEIDFVSQAFVSRIKIAASNFTKRPNYLIVISLQFDNNEHIYI